VSETTKALFKDALYQVLDNKVFRLLAILVLFLVLPTFLIAARTDALVILFGWKTYAYTDVFSTFDLPYPGLDAEAHATLIQTVQKLLVEQIGGTFGLIFAVAATAFFVPRMVEKGAADTIFSKPVSRTALLFSRYLAGLLFVAILATVLVLGMHMGLLLNSGYSDAGFLWSIPVLVYKYAILHAFSLLIAVWTRSSVAAILTTLLFFAFNGCVHAGWEVKEMRIERNRILISAGENKDGDDPSKLVDAFLLTLDTLHYTLPKTSDAALISQRLRRAIAERSLAFKDETSGLRVAYAPKEFKSRAVALTDLPTIAIWEQTEGIGRLTLKRFDYKQRKLRAARDELDKQLADMGIQDVKKDREWMMNTRAESRSWMEPRGDQRVWRKTVFAVGNVYLFEVDAELPEDWAEGTAPIAVGPREARVIGHKDGELDRFLRSFEQKGASARDPDSFMDEHASWGGPLKYNLYFSLASTLAFIALLLALACWKLSRIDF
jgi:ABC-type transport system involved in multi-copper enzyme maturation permease subunit